MDSTLRAAVNMRALSAGLPVDRDSKQAAGHGVLMIAYYFPPAGEVGVFRTLKFAKYMPDFGFRPVVLTVRNRSRGQVDTSLQVPAGATVVETFSAEHRFMRAPKLLGIDPKWFLLPDPQIGWLPFAVRRGEDLVRRHGTELIYATAPPFTSLLIGHALKRRTGLPLVLDFRDPWTQNAFTHYPTRLHRELEARMERTAINSADWVVTSTESNRRALLDRYPHLRGRCETILNGFEPSDFAGLSRPARSNRFTVAYTGRLYGLRSAHSFLTALATLIRGDPSLREEIRVIFAGPRDVETGRASKQLGLQDLVEQTGFVSHRESLEIMMNADVLLLIMSEREVMDGGLGAMMVPGKTFEYLGAGRPILALAPPGEAAALITRTSSGCVVRPDDVQGVVNALSALIERWRAGSLTLPERDLRMFQSRTLTASLARVFEATLRNLTAAPVDSVYG